ncbi:heavy-metal-associated domain-containing protein [Flavobacterium sp.]|uniref:heavy-metal-associated domain-containing protein n=1 Tax=Flavobacterium sp. TaxID=239 RepID=UPI003B9B2436
MKNLVYLVLLFVAFSAQAQQKNKNAKVSVEVNGNCEQCKKRIEKAAYSVPGVKSAEWHIDDKVLHLIINETKCSVTDVEKAVAKIGHDTKNVKADDETYNNLHHCCKYDRKE